MDNQRQKIGVQNDVEKITKAQLLQMQALGNSRLRYGAGSKTTQKYILHAMCS